MNAIVLAIIAICIYSLFFKSHKSEKFTELKDMMDVNDCPVCQHRPKMKKYNHPDMGWLIFCEGKHIGEEHEFCYSYGLTREQAISKWNKCPDVQP